MSNIIFGITEINDSIFQVINFLILFGKHYIFRQKYLKEQIFFIGYLNELKYRIAMEKLLLYQENKGHIFEILWKTLENNL